MPELEFVDELPEAAPRTRAATRDRADAIKANPGKWAKWPSTMAANSVLKSLTAAAGEGFETTTRKVDGKAVTFARFVPSTNGHEAPPSSSDPPAAEETRNGNGWRTVCPGCGNEVPIEEGETRAQTLARHARTKPACAAVIKRHASVKR